MYLLDANVCIDFMNNRNPILTQRLLSHHPSELLISSVTVFELEYGAAKSNWGERTRQKLAMFLAPFDILSFNTDDAVAAANVRAYLKKLGAIIGPYDIQLAGQTLAKNLILVTHNTKEFQRVPNLQLEDWAI